MIPAGACYLGWRESRNLLALLVEAEMLDGSTSGRALTIRSGGSGRWKPTAQESEEDGRSDGRHQAETCCDRGHAGRPR